MIRVIRVEKGSLSDKLGLSAGDQIVRINGQAVEDFIDFRFLTADSLFKLELLTRGSSQRRVLTVERKAGQPLGGSVDEGPLLRCRNKCIFCFIDQLPSGLRQSLYIKDEDYRYSFLRGNYITGTSLREHDIGRIIRMGLGPLYISVHATDPKIRAAMLGCPGPAEVMHLLRRLAEGGISLHFQIVLCPGINDGSVLEKTVSDLAGLGPGAVSLAVVPVGLSAHREGLAELEAVTPKVAGSTLKLIHKLQKEYLRQRGGRFVFAADEFYLLARRQIPSARAYEGYPQLENGVGLIRHSLDSIEKALRPKRMSPSDPECRYRIVTGPLYAPIIRDRLLPRLRSRVSGNFEVTVVENSLLGDSITVAGLLAGRDILKALERDAPADIYFLPAFAVNDNGFFLDDLHLDDLRRKLAPAVVIAAEEVADILALVAENKLRSSASRQI
ncbi:MAG TPA: DUF512 domain-containing protein [archaeon]|nr:DUF512 domain-containing protein [archaeon]